MASSNILVFGYYRRLDSDPQVDLINLTHSFYDVSRGKYMYSISKRFDIDKNKEYDMKIIDLHSDIHKCTPYSLISEHISKASSHFIDRFEKGNYLIAAFEHPFTDISMIDTSLVDNNTFTSCYIDKFPPTQNQNDYQFISGTTPIQYKNEILCIGYLETYSPRGDIFSFNISTMKWKQWKNFTYPSNYPICCSSLLIKESKLFIIGGIKDGETGIEPVNNVNVINLDEDAKKSAVSLKPMNAGRAGDSCFMNDGRIVTGGVTGYVWHNKLETSIEFYDMQKDEWTSYLHKTNEMHNNTALWCNESIVMMAGYGETNGFDGVGHMEWVDIRQNAKSQFWDEKSLAVILDCVPAKDYVSLAMLR